MDLVKTVIRRDSWDADKRLAEMQLVREPLLECRDVAISEAANATAFHPANAAGTFSYHHGTWALRDRFVGEDWVECRADGIETIRNDKLKIKIAYCNVDVACDAEHPKPRSKKGAGAERACGGLFGDLPQYAPRPTGDYALYYLMVDGDGAVELTRPVLQGGTFTGAVERIFLSFGKDDDEAVIADDKTGPVDNFDPQVVRK
jgi:hypothetical protein